MLTRRSRRAGGVSPLSVCNRRSPTCGERGPSAPCLCAFGGRRHAASGGRQPPVCVRSTVTDMRRAGGVSPLSVRNRRSPTCGERGPSAPCLCAIDGRRHAASGGRQPPVCVQSTVADMRRAGGVSPLSVCNRQPPTWGERGPSAPCLCAFDGRRHAASGGRQPPVCVQSAAADVGRAGGVSPLSVCNRQPPTCGERGASAPCLCAIGGRRRGASLNQRAASAHTTRPWT